MDSWIFRPRCRGDSHAVSKSLPVREERDDRQPPRSRKLSIVLAVVGCALLNWGCADEAFIPPPDNSGQAATSDDSDQRVAPQPENW